MQRLEVSGAVRHIYIYVIRRLKVNSHLKPNTEHCMVHNECTQWDPTEYRTMFCTGFINYVLFVDGIIPLYLNYGAWGSVVVKALRY
jgi:hypothetical protein